MKKYKIIYADPPWRYEKLNMYDKKGINNKVYNRMELEEICKLNINEISNENSVLLLWTTSPFMEKAFKVIKSWGFKYVTIAFVWIKTYPKGNIITGMGRYTRSACEFVLLARKGKGIIRKHTNIHQVLQSNLTKHSAKPIEIKERIRNLFGDVSCIELFAREKTKGWDVWGDEVESDIELNKTSTNEGK